MANKGHCKSLRNAVWTFYIQNCELNKPVFFIKLVCLRHVMIAMRNGLTERASGL